MASPARGPHPGRAAEVAASLAAVRSRIAVACEAAGRDPGEVTLVAITKTFPATDIRILSGLGVRDVGENRDQEAAPKAAELADLRDQLTWHFVGQLQTNKAASVARYADVVHSVDRPRLVTALGTAARKAGRLVCCLVQVSLDDDPARGGAPAGQVLAIADAVASEASLRLGGVMAVAPLAAESHPGGALAAFQRLAGMAGAVRAAHPAATMISAGMSADLEDAIAAGATHVRVGTALLGGRPGFVR
ncbi:MAG TPA: YggS family pyridoxal phosphate-dependent enzyme [Streptosporangiaceae bacterium]|nr:YggS family pyridoxal phosphate-dependent enzyme [Streptosporangiaceae bacterium]